MPRKGKQFVLMFFAIDSADHVSPKTGLSFANTDMQLSKDGGDFANCTNSATELANGWYKVTLTSAEMAYDLVAFKAIKAGADKVNLLITTDGFPVATVATDAGNGAASFKTDRTEATDNYWNDCWLMFVSGDLAGQVKRVTDYVGSTKVITLESALTGTPADGDRFVLINV